MNENSDYAWRFTGDQYLDGVIFAVGSPRNKFCVAINLSSSPLGIIEKIEKRFNEIGYEASCTELPNAMTKESDLRLMATGPYPIFTVATLPRYRLRRVDMENIPIEFMCGIFTVCSNVRLGRHSVRDNFKDDAIMIRSALPREDLLQLLLKLGIDEYRIYANHVWLDKEVFEGKQPFEEVYREYLKEEKYFDMETQSREGEMAKKMEQMQKEMWDGPKADKFDDRNYDYDEPEDKEENN